MRSPTFIYGQRLKEGLFGIILSFVDEFYDRNGRAFQPRADEKTFFSSMSFLWEMSAVTSVLLAIKFF